MVRELTKLYEEYQRGFISDVIRWLTDHSLKGECLIIVSGKEAEEMTTIDDERLKQEVEKRVATGQKTNQAIKEVAKRFQRKKQDVYRLYHGLDIPEQ